MTEKRNKALTVLAYMLIVVVAFLILKELKSIFIPFLVLLFPLNSWNIMNTPAAADTFNQTQKKNSRVKAAYADQPTQ